MAACLKEISIISFDKSAMQDEQQNPEGTMT